MTVASAGSDSAYVEAVQESEPTHWWRFNETTGTALADSAGFQPVTTTAGPTLGVPGPDRRRLGHRDPVPRHQHDACLHDRRWTARPTCSPSRRGSARRAGGGKIIGRGNRNDRNSSKMDRHLYLNNAGQVVFGVKPNQTRQVVTSPNSYNNGAWHQATATLSSAGMRCTSTEHWWRSAPT